MLHDNLDFSCRLSMFHSLPMFDSLPMFHSHSHNNLPTMKMHGMERPTRWPLEGRNSLDV